MWGGATAPFRTIFFCIFPPPFLSSIFRFPLSVYKTRRCVRARHDDGRSSRIPPLRRDRKKMVEVPSAFPPLKDHLLSSPLLLPRQTKTMPAMRLRLLTTTATKVPKRMCTWIGAS